MNKKIPLRTLAEFISGHSGSNIEESQLFVKTLFSIVSDQLLSGETVTIDGLGTFVGSPNPDEPVRLIVDPALADELNAPFSMFSEVTIAGDTQLEGIEEIEVPEVETDEESVVESEVEPVNPIEEIVPIPETEEAKMEDPEAPKETDESVCDSTDTEESTVVEQPMDDTDIQDDTVAEPESSEPVDAPPTVSAIENPVPEDKSEKDANTDVIVPDLPDTTENAESMPPEIPVPVDDDEPVCTVDSSVIPEEEEEYADYYEEPKSKFWPGFFVGLIAGLIIGALCFVGYVLYFVETGTKLF